MDEDDHEELLNAPRRQRADRHEVGLPKSLGMEFQKFIPRSFAPLRRRIEAVFPENPFDRVPRRRGIVPGTAGVVCQMLGPVVAIVVVVPADFL